MTKFMRETAERAIKTAAQTALALFGAGAVNVLDVDWQNIAAVSAGAALVSVLTSVASLPVGPPDSASVVE